MNKVPWKYCECGCKCFVATLNGTMYSYLIDWNKDKSGNNIWEKARYFLKMSNNYKWKEFPNKEDLDEFVANDAVSRINFER
jgi:hypothetical protein